MQPRAAHDCGWPPVATSDDLVTDPSKIICGIRRPVRQLRGCLRGIDTEARAVPAMRLSVKPTQLMADGIMLTTTQAWDAVLWTQDSDFEGVARDTS